MLILRVYYLTQKLTYNFIKFLYVILSSVFYVFRLFIVFNEVSRSSTQTPQLNTSVPHKDHTFSAPKIPQFHTKNSSVQYKNPLTSTTKAPQFHTPFGVGLRGVLDWGVFGVELRGFWCGTEGCVELTGFRCWTERFLLWNWGVSGVELRGPFLMDKNGRLVTS